MTKEIEALSRIAEAKPGEPVELTEDEIETLRKVAEFWRGLEAIGKIGASFQRIATWIGWLIALYIAVKTNAIDWLKTAILK